LLPLGSLGTKCLPCAGNDSRHKRDDRCRCGRKAHLVPSHGFLELVKTARRAWDDGVVFSMSPEVRPQALCCLITPPAILLEALHDDPIEVATQLADQFA